MWWFRQHCQQEVTAIKFCVPQSKAGYAWLGPLPYLQNTAKCFCALSFVFHRKSLHHLWRFLALATKSRLHWLHRSPILMMKFSWRQL